MGFYSRYNDVYDKFERLCSTCPYDNTEDRIHRKERLNRSEHDYDWQPEYLWCDKIGGKHWQFGYCEDAEYSSGPVFITPREDKCTSRGRAYRRSWKENERVRAEREIRNLGWSGRYYYRGYRTIEDGWVEDTSHPRKIVRKSKKSFKRGAARKVRKTMYLTNGGDYKRIESSWWD